MIEAPQLFGQREYFPGLGFGELELQGLIVVGRFLVNRVAVLVQRNDRRLGPGALEVLGECDDRLGARRGCQDEG